MMKMAGRVLWCCLALLLTLSSVSAIQRLNTIQDLKRIGFGSSVPTHSLVLLYWFAHTIYFYYNDEIQLTFNPRSGDYGSHRFSNLENLLAPPSGGQRDFIIGNIEQNTSQPLPNYVINPPYMFDGENRDRIIIRVNGRMIDHVYLTQHYGNANSEEVPWYDPDHTYEITTNLLRQIREFPQQANVYTLQHLSNCYGGNVDVSDITHTGGGLASLVLLFCIVTQTRLTFQEQSKRTENKTKFLLLLFLLVVLCVGAFILLNAELPRV